MMTLQVTALLTVVVLGTVFPAASYGQLRTVERFQIMRTSETGWGGYCSLEFSGQREQGGHARLVCHDAPEVAVLTGRMTVRLDKAKVIPAPDIARFIDLITRAELYDGRHVGSDSRSGDGLFERLQIWVNSPVRTVILVTSNNPSFHGGDEARTQLLQELTCVEERLRDQADPERGPSTRCPAK